MDKQRQEEILKRYASRNPRDELASSDREQAVRFLDLSVEQQTALLVWMQVNLKRTRTINHKRTSYEMKSYFERDINGFYVSNGQFKGAMLLLGFKPLDQNELNWHFNVSERSFAIFHERKRGCC